MTLVPLSSMATVVPTGIAWLESATFMSAIDAKRLPESTKMPKRFNNVADGSLNGNGMSASRKLPPGASTSLNSPGCNGSSSFLTLMPLALKPAGRFASVPASINCLKIDVDDWVKPPIMWVKPKP